MTSTIHRNPSDNVSREPSVLVAELRDYLNKRHPHQPPRCVAHPLQPFSQALFDSSQPALHTFASEWAPPVEKPVTVALTDTATTTPPADAQISVQDFQRFWRNPSNWYCRRVLGIALWRDDQEPEDTEPFDVNALSQYQLRSGLIDLLLQQPDTTKVSASLLLQRSGVLPHGGLGDLVFNGVYEEAQAMVYSIQEHQPTPIPALDIELSVNGQELLGRLTGAVSWPDGSTGLLHHHASSLKGNHLSGLWLAHLIGSAAETITGQSLLVTKDKAPVALAVVAPLEAKDKLQPWFDGWNIGQTRALPFFANTSAILAGAIKGNPTSAWLSSGFGSTGESEEEAIQLLYSNAAGLYRSDEVLDWAMRLLGDVGVQQ